MKAPSWKIQARLRMFRMKREEASYLPGFAGLPYVILAVLWVLIWCLWPSANGTPRRANRAGIPPRVFLATGHDSLYIKPFAHHAWTRATGDEEENNAGRLPPLPPHEARYLDRPGEDPETALLNSLEPVSTAAGRELTGYRPFWPANPVFTEGRGGDMKVTVRMSDALETLGFRFPDFPASVTNSGKAWTAAVTVEIGDAGLPEHVFLETPSENKDVNKAVVRTISQGMLAKPGQKCEGKIKIEYRKE